jgi:hypothetical protein
MSTDYHHSVRHYTSPFPLGHRNARPMPSRSSNLGPWGVAHHSERVATSPLSATFDQRNQSRVPFHSAARTSARASSTGAASPGRADPAGTTAGSSMDQHQLGDSQFLATQSSDLSTTSDPQGITSPPYLQPPPQLRHIDPTGWADAMTKYAPPYHDDGDIRYPPHPEAQFFDRVTDTSGEVHRYPDTATQQLENEAYGHLHGGEMLPHGKGLGEYSDVALQRRADHVVPVAWDLPHTLRLAYQRGDGVGETSGASPRRRGPSRVPCGYIYKNTGQDGFMAPTHVQVPMGYRPMGSRPQIAAKVTQHSPWKPLDEQTPLPTLEHQRSAPVQRLAATPLIIEVDERLAAEGLGSLLDIRYASDEHIANVLMQLGFGASDRMTILWELRRKHPLPAQHQQRKQ